MERHRTAIELDKPKARELRDLAEDHSTDVSIIVRAMISHFLGLPDGDTRGRVETALDDAAAAEKARRGAVAGEALYDRDGGELAQSHADQRRRMSLVLEKGQAPAMKEASGTSASVAMRALVTYDLGVINGTDGVDTDEKNALVDALADAAAAEKARRAGVGKKVMTERHAASRGHGEPEDGSTTTDSPDSPHTGDEKRE